MVTLRNVVASALADIGMLLLLGCSTSAGGGSGGGQSATYDPPPMGTEGVEAPIRCGTFWRQYIPNDEGDGVAWGYDAASDQDVIIQWWIGAPPDPTRIVGGTCLSPHLSEIVDDGPCMVDCQGVFDYYMPVADAMRDTLLSLCLDAMESHFQPPLSAPQDPGHDGCEDAQLHWVKHMDWERGRCGECKIMSTDCTEVCEQDTDSEGESYVTGGGGPEPFSSYVIACSGTHWGCEVPGALIEEFHEMSVDEFMKTSTRLEQYMIGGGPSGPIPVGMQFTGVVSGSLADKLGFQNGDIVQEVNGLPFTHVGEWWDVFVELESASSVMLKVYRGSNTVFPEFTRVP